MGKQRNVCSADGAEGYEKAVHRLQHEERVEAIRKVAAADVNPMPIQPCSISKITAIRLLGLAVKRRS